ncbi:hypothetical protein B0T13DRAFT_144828 [Neurospora crassa]|nr:hypothetical protein B0T13DRAFT_144828 [Neurospora crassa]
MKPVIIENIASGLAHSDTREREREKERERDLCWFRTGESVRHRWSASSSFDKPPPALTSLFQLQRHDLEHDKTTTTTKTFQVRIRAPAGCLAVVARAGSYRDELGHHGPVNMRPRQALHATIVPYLPWGIDRGLEITRKACPILIIYLHATTWMACRHQHPLFEVPICKWQLDHHLYGTRNTEKVLLETISPHRAARYSPSATISRYLTTLHWIFSGVLFSSCPLSPPPSPPQGYFQCLCG